MSATKSQQKVNTVPRPRRWASRANTAKHLGVDLRTVDRMTADGRLTSYRNGSRVVRFDLNEVDAAMQPSGGGAA